MKLLLSYIIFITTVMTSAESDQEPVNEYNVEANIERVYKKTLKIVKKDVKTEGIFDLKGEISFFKELNEKLHDFYSIYKSDGQKWTIEEREFKNDEENFVFLIFTNKFKLPYNSNMVIKFKKSVQNNLDELVKKHFYIVFDVYNHNLLKSKFEEWSICLKRNFKLVLFCNKNPNKVKKYFDDVHLRFIRSFAYEMLMIAQKVKLVSLHISLLKSNSTSLDDTLKKDFLKLLFFNSPDFYEEYKKFRKSFIDNLKIKKGLKKYTEYYQIRNLFTTDDYKVLNFEPNDKCNTELNNRIDNCFKALNLIKKKNILEEIKYSSNNQRVYYFSSLFFAIDDIKIFIIDENKNIDYIVDLFVNTDKKLTDEKEFHKEIIQYFILTYTFNSIVEKKVDVKDRINITHDEILKCPDISDEFKEKIKTKMYLAEEELERIKEEIKKQKSIKNHGGDNTVLHTNHIDLNSLTKTADSLYLNAMHDEIIRNLQFNKERSEARKLFGKKGQKSKNNVFNKGEKVKVAKNKLNKD